MSELKRRKTLRDKAIESNKSAKQKKAAAALAAASASKRRRSMKKSATDDDGDDLEVVGAEADDLESEFIRNVCEKEVLAPDTLLSAFVPLVVHICSNPKK